MRSNVTILLVTLGVLGPGPGCDSVVRPVQNRGCTPGPINYGVEVDLTDPSTGEPVSGATLTLTYPDGREEVMAESEFGPGEYRGAAGNAGTFVLSIQAEGYFTPIDQGIEVRADECGIVATEFLELALEPL